MSKVAITYWGNTNTASTSKLKARPKTRPRMKSSRETATPQWFFFAVVVSITFMLCLTINFRAFSELNTEIDQNTKLNIEVEQLTNQNLAIQDEIHNIKTDPKMIENEARKLGMGRIDEKIFVPAN